MAGNRQIDKQTDRQTDSGRICTVYGDLIKLLPSSFVSVIIDIVIIMIDDDDDDDDDRSNDNI